MVTLKADPNTNAAFHIDSLSLAESSSVMSFMVYDPYEYYEIYLVPESRASEGKPWFLAYQFMKVLLMEDSFSTLS